MLIEINLQEVLGELPLVLSSLYFRFDKNNNIFQPCLGLKFLICWCTSSLQSKPTFSFFPLDRANKPNVETKLKATPYLE